MKKPTPKHRAAAANQPLSLPSENERSMTLARSGGMTLTELMGCAEGLSQAGQPAAAAALYETWIANTVSPLQHVACFNWGTVLGTLGRHADAERAYHRALALSADFL